MWEVMLWLANTPYKKTLPLPVGWLAGWAGGLAGLVWLVWAWLPWLGWLACGGKLVSSYIH